MESVAYRFVPCDGEGRPQENSQFTTVTDVRLGIGSTLDAEVFGYSRWEVIEVRDDTGPIVDVRDEAGRDIPLVGTVICRGVT